MPNAAILTSDFSSRIADYLDLTVNVFNYRPSGRAAVRRDLELLARFARDRGHDTVTGDTILEFLAHLRTDRSNSSASLNRKISSIRTYVRHLRFRQVTGAAELPVECLQRAREPYCGPVQVLTPDEVRRLIASVDRGSMLGVRDHLLFWMLYRLGLRLGEALAVDLTDVDLEQEVLTIHGKGRRERTLPLVPDLADLVKDWLLLRARLMGARRETALFLSKKGHRLSPRTAQESFQKTVAQAGPLSVAKVTPHGLRHAFASHALEGNADLVVLKAVLGHARMESTHLYLHPSMRLLRKAVNDHLASEILATLIAENVVPLRVHQRRKREVRSAA
jgi:site-specific recombinase XerD